MKINYNNCNTHNTMPIYVICPNITCGYYYKWIKIININSPWGFTLVSNHSIFLSPSFLAYNTKYSLPQEMVSGQEPWRRLTKRSVLNLQSCVVGRKKKKKAFHSEKCSGFEWCQRALKKPYKWHPYLSIFYLNCFWFNHCRELPWCNIIQNDTKHRGRSKLLVRIRK